MMPLRVLCERCNFTLYEGDELKPPYEIIEEYDGRCPRCAKKLSYIPERFEIRPVERVSEYPQ